MNINGIGSNTISALTALSTPDNAAASDAAAATAPTPASSSTVSKPGELMGKLSQLLQQDPAKFKQVTQQISDELKTAAASASGPQEQILSKLSANFAQASSSGNLTPLEPPAGGEAGGASAAHHHHHHGGGGGHHGAGASGGIASVLSTALDQVNQALTGSATSPNAHAT